MPSRLSRAALGLLLTPAVLVAQAQTPPGPRAGFATELPSIARLLDRYRSGAFDAAVGPLANVGDPRTFRASFVQAADAWIAGEPADGPNRRLVAAAFAIEVAHTRLFYDSLSTMLVDWAAQEMWKGSPSRAEQAWLLAGVAVLERGERGFNLPLQNPKNREGAIGFPRLVKKAIDRFPDEPRFRLAQALWKPSRRIRGDLEKLAKDPVVGADALVQLAYLELGDRDFRAAIRLAQEAVNRALEPSTVYVAHFIIAFCHEAQGRPAEALSAYAAALRAVPRGQSASIALALLLMRDNQSNAAFDLVDRSLAEDPEGDDPLRLFAYGGYVRWPLLVADGRKSLR